MIVAEIYGDITEAPEAVIAHGVNCQNVMGSGVAKALYQKWPKVKEEYHAHSVKFEAVYINGQEDALGCVSHVEVGEGKTVLNCFTQEFYGRDKKVYVSYQAIRDCFEAINLHFSDEIVAIPQIGCGLAGGDWETVKNIINEMTPDTDIVVYSL